MYKKVVFFFWSYFQIWIMHCRIVSHLSPIETIIKILRTDSNWMCWFYFVFDTYASHFTSYATTHTNNEPIELHEFQTGWTQENKTKIIYIWYSVEFVLKIRYNLSKNLICFLYLGFTARHDYFTNFEPSQSLGGAKTGTPRGKPSDYP